MQARYLQQARPSCRKRPLLLLLLLLLLVLLLLLLFLLPLLPLPLQQALNMSTSPPTKSKTREGIGALLGTRGPLTITYKA